MESSLLSKKGQKAKAVEQLAMIDLGTAVVSQVVKDAAIDRAKLALLESACDQLAQAVRGYEPIRTSEHTWFDRNHATPFFWLGLRSRKRVTYSDWFFWRIRYQRYSGDYVNPFRR